MASDFYERLMDNDDNARGVDPTQRKRSRDQFMGSDDDTEEEHRSKRQRSGSRSPSRSRSRSPSPSGSDTESTSEQKQQNSESKSSFLHEQPARDHLDTERFVATSMFNGDWGEPSEDDKWCFMRDMSQTEETRKDNPFYQQLMAMHAMYGSFDTFRLCCHIQRFYKEQMMDYDGTGRVWTLRSIRAWLEETATKASMAEVLTRLAFKKVLLMAESQLCKLDTFTQQRVDTGKHDARFDKAVRTLNTLLNRKS